MNNDVKSLRFRRIFKWLGAGTGNGESQKGLSANRQSPPPAAPPATAAVKKELGKILVLDDDLIIQRTVKAALEKKGYKAFTVGEISSALGIIRQEKPDLILLDLSFPFNPDDVGGPARDGFFLVEWLRRASGGHTIPIIIISGTDPAKYKAQISDGGIVACFQKPLAHDELLTAIHNALGGGRWD